MDWLSCEWTLKHRSNSGSIVFLRSLIVSLYIFAFALWLPQVVDPDRTWSPSVRETQIAVRDNFAWLGAIFAALYTGFYARYASQWTYIAGLYNQIKSAASTSSIPIEKNEPLLNWQSGFIEDCYHLHLDRKEVFAFIIKQMLSDTVMQNNFIECTAPEIADIVLERAGVIRQAN
ncbi:hypothetical protein Xbuh_19340 [Xanthomonas axonopodis pv. bauhiniae]|nr:hypothetical protein Xbuh_19340 [Xanthomonas axonopodis pv. bauhiniae]